MVFLDCDLTEELQFYMINENATRLKKITTAMSFVVGFL